MPKNLFGYRAWTSTLPLNRRTRLGISRSLLYEKIDINSIYKVIDVYAYLDVSTGLKKPDEN